jgi:hypothetical protein
MSVAMIVAAVAAGAQQPATTATARGGTPAAVLPPGCVVVRITAPPTDSQRRAARDLAQRGQQAAILGDRVSALAQLREAASLDPSDPDLAYQLARAHEGAGASSDAAREYCRFLSLSPDAPDATEVRERVAVLTAEAQERAAVVASTTPPAAPKASPLSPQRVLSLGLVIPGGGQFYAGRPIRGALALGGAVVALGWGMGEQSGVREVEETALDPFGNPYTYTTLQATTTRPHLAMGIAAAVAIGVASAIDAYNFSRHANGQGLTLDLVPSATALALRVTVR